MLAGGDMHMCMHMCMCMCMCMHMCMHMCMGCRRLAAASPTST